MLIVHHTGSSSLAGTRQSILAASIRLGRRPECEVRFDAQRDISVSGLHAEVRVDGQRIFVRDAGSTNGTFVNGVRITAEAELQQDDVVRLGQNGPEMKFTLTADAAPAATDTPVAKRGVGVQTLERAIGRERSHAKRNLLLAMGGLVLAVGLVALWLQQRQGTIEESVRLTAEQVRKDFDRSLAEVQKQHTEELTALKGQISEGEGKLSTLIVEIESRDRALHEIEAKADRATSAEVALKKELEEKLRVLHQNLAKQEKSLREQEGRLAPDWAGLLERYKRSVFLCLGQSEKDAQGRYSQSIGTAWVCREDGILATNAHVAEFLKDTKTWKTLVCVQNESGEPFAIQDVLMHKQYSGPSSPDVALVRIDTKGKNLVAFPLADATQLRALRIGTQVGTIGYPGELMFEYVRGRQKSGELVRAQATFKEGWVGRILDFAGARAPFERSHSLQHSASLSGGTSGSPMFTKDGLVVALHNAGNDFYVQAKRDANAPDEIKRLSSPAQIGWAVRVDLLKELLRDSGW